MLNSFARRQLVLGAAATLAGSLAGAALAQSTWPNRPVRLVVPFPPGGLTDAYARQYGEFLSRKFGQPFVVDNKTGAGGTLGIGEVAKAAPDGYTFVLSTSGSFWQSRVLYRKLPFDADKDLTPIALFPSGALLLAVPASLPVKNVRELLDYSRKNTVNMGSYAAGAWPHMIADTWNQTENLQIVTANYRGEVPMWVDVASGLVQMAVGSAQGVLPHVQRGAVRPIAATGTARSPRFPDVPTFAEQGMTHPVFTLEGHLPICAPTGTPNEILEKMADGILEAWASPKIKELHQNFGIATGPIANLAQARQTWAKDSVQWINLADKLGIKLD